MPSFAFSDEQQQLVQTARDFTRKEIVPVAGKLDEKGSSPRRSARRRWETGLMNCEIPEAFGGLGLSCLSHCLVQEEIAYGCTGINTSMAGNSLGDHARSSSPAPTSRRRSTSGGCSRRRSSRPTAAPSPTPAPTSPA